MAGGGPGSSSRGRGGKFKKFTRGGQSAQLIPPKTLGTQTDSDPGGKHFSRDLRPLDADGNEIGRKKDSDEESEEDSEEESSEEESDDAGPSAQGTSAAELSREERKQEKKARKEAAIARSKKPVEVGDLPPSDSDSDEEEAAAMPSNPNHSRKARQQTKPVAAVDEATESVAKLSVAPSRREREAIEAAAAKERYRKLHEAGKTDEAKADLARLRLIREKREADAARKQVCLLQPSLGLFAAVDADTETGREGGEGSPGQGQAHRA